MITTTEGGESDVNARVDDRLGRSCRNGLGQTRAGSIPVRHTMRTVRRYERGTKMEATLLAEALNALTFDGDKFELPNGLTLKLKSEPDDCDIEQLWSDECYGKIAPVETNRYSNRDAERPEGFDGRACKIDYSRGYDRMWWQPPADVTAEHLPALHSLVRDILIEGFSSMGVELLDGDDVVIDREWMGGIEPTNPHSDDGKSYIRDIVGDLVVEVMGRYEDKRVALAADDARAELPYMVGAE